MEQKYIDICIAGNYFSSIGQFKDLIKKLFSGNWTKDTFQDIQELVQLTRAGRVKDWIESFESIDENIGSLLRRTECAEDLSDDEILCELADSCGIKDKFYEAKASLISLAASNTEKRNGSALFTFEFNVFNKCTLSINFSFVVKRKGYDDEVFKQTHNLLRDNFKAAFIVPEFTQADYFLFIDGVGSPVWKNADEKNSGLLKGASITSPSAFIRKDNALEFNVGDVTFNMIRVEHGQFTMGAIDDREYFYGEKTAHKVILKNDYYIGETVVTQKLWKAVMGNNPSQFEGDNLPVEQVSWDDCQEFILKLNHITGQVFRLPTEAEWEFAARGGNKSSGFMYPGSNNLEEVAWYDENSRGKTHPVAELMPNELGIFDMSGNVNEWCEDWYGEYKINEQLNPRGPHIGLDRMTRGGSWFFDSSLGFFVWSRTPTHPNRRHGSLGLRLASSTSYEGDELLLKELIENNNIGTINYSNGDSYEGAIKDGKPHGYGIWRSYDNCCFRGLYNDGAPQYGAFRNPKGINYFGNWKNWKKNGYGKGADCNNATYTGMWVNDKRSGKGVMEWPDGDKYEGDWVDGKMTGYGTYFYSDGTIKTGHWDKDRYVG